MRIVLVICVLVALFVTGMYLPYRMEVAYRCSCCGARAARFYLVCIPVRFTVRQTPLSRYWYQSVDKNHKHGWIPVERYEDDLMGGRQAELVAWGHPRWSLSDECAICVLQSLPDSASRKALMTRLWGRGKNCSRPEVKDLRLLIGSLQVAYNEKPGRRDWPAVLRRLGAWPP